MRKMFSLLLIIMSACSAERSEIQGRVSAVEANVLLIEVQPADRARFAELTRTHLGRKLEVVLDGELIGSPTVREPITDGRVKISFDQPRATHITPGSTVSLKLP